jgi:Spy/CpxP family protein refolding chaperone
MTIRKRIGAVALGLVAVALLGQLPLVAQEPATSKQAAPTAKKKQDHSRRVPNYFGQIGLTTEQRASIYSIQANRVEKIEALEKQIATEKAEMLAQCENVLNETQKKLLDNLRKVAAEPAPKAAAPSKPVETLKTSN